jgi:hypothetical protein
MHDILQRLILGAQNFFKRAQNLFKEPKEHIILSISPTNWYRKKPIKNGS